MTQYYQSLAVVMFYCFSVIFAALVAYLVGKEHGRVEQQIDTDREFNKLRKTLNNEVYEKRKN